MPAPVVPQLLGFSLTPNGLQVRVYDSGSHIANINIEVIQGTYLRPGGVFTYYRPDGSSKYLRPS